MSAFTAVYLIVILLLVLGEGIAIGRPERGDTISEHVWALRASAVAVWVVVPAFVWMTAHFVLPWEPDGRSGNDVVYVAVGLAVAAWNHWYARR